MAVRAGVALALCATFAAAVVEAPKTNARRVEGKMNVHIVVRDSGGPGGPVQPLVPRIGLAIPIASTQGRHTSLHFVHTPHTHTRRRQRTMTWGG